MLLPVAEVAAGFGQRPLADLKDEPCCLGYRKDLVRHHPTAGRVPPAQEGLNRHQGAVWSVDDGLVCKMKLLPLKGIAQVISENLAV